MDTGYEYILNGFITVWGAVVSFFLYKLLAIAKQVNELHHIYLPNHHMAFEKFVEDNRQQIANFHSRLTTIEKSIVEIKFETMRACRFISDGER